MTRKTLLLGTALSGLIISTLQPACAQTVLTDNAKTPVKIGTISKSAARAAQSRIPKKAPYTVSIIGKQQIELASPAANAQTLLNQLPSVVAVSAGPNGMRTNIQFRAFNDGQFSETFGGVALNDIFNAGVVNSASARNNNLVTLDDFTQVEAFRGVNNPAVNSYNSLGGTINFIPREAPSLAGGQAGVSYGSFNSFDTHIRVATGDLGGLRQLLSIRRAVDGSWLQNAKDQNNHLYYTFNAPIFGGTGKIYGYFLYNKNRGLTPHTVPQALIQQFGANYQFPTTDTYSENIDTNDLAVLGASQQLTSIFAADLKFFFGADNYTRTSFSNPYQLQSATMPYQLPNSPATFPYSPGQTSYNPIAQFGSYPVGAQYHFYGNQATEIGVQPKFTLDLPHNSIVFGGNLTAGHLHSREYWYGTAPVP